ncbi:MAG TPA: J domain-containing protein [Chitinophagaceae bacterium]|jgi:curved DNA-binding protein CbpA|nr:J domain-containing protein [Chitinophagaceae bacterium]HMU58096.1 J domain-containing protein [Chitinophagaceae bacterium]
MFIDYYAILEINENSTQEEIKAAFRKQAIKWHPDRNPGIDTTTQMQRINESYLILKDPEARQKFNTEYQRFKVFREQQQGVKQDNQYQQQQQNHYQQQTHSQQENRSKQQERKTEYADYSFTDETLKNWMNNARKQSVDLAKQTIKEFKGMVALGLKEGVKASGIALLGQIIIGFIFLIIFGLAKSCHS